MGEAKRRGKTRIAFEHFSLPGGVTRNFCDRLERYGRDALGDALPIVRLACKATAASVTAAYPPGIRLAGLHTLVLQQLILDSGLYARAIHGDAEFKLGPRDSDGIGFIGASNPAQYHAWLAIKGVNGLVAYADASTHSFKATAATMTDGGPAINVTWDIPECLIWSYPADLFEGFLWNRGLSPDIGAWLYHESDATSGSGYDAVNTVSANFVNILQNARDCFARLKETHCVIK